MDGISNLWAVLAAAVSSIVIGALWYGPLFQKRWMRLAGITEEGMKSMALTPVQAMAGGVVTSVLSAVVFVWLADTLSVVTAMDAIRMAFWAWLGFAVPISAGSWLWEGKSHNLFILNAAYYLVAWSVVALIVGLWR